MILTFRKLKKNNYIQTFLIIGLIALVIFGAWFGIQAALNTKIIPVLAVTSGSMCIPYDAACEGLHPITHPFERTLHTGDLIIIQGADPEKLNTNYPNSDIIVYQDPRYPTDPNQKIVHRIVGRTEINGTLYFYTKGDGNPYHKYPDALDEGEYDYWSPISADSVYGKVVMRIPLLGNLPIYIQELSKNLGFNASYLLITIIAILITLLLLQTLLHH